MKKLLFLTNILVVSLLIHSCHSTTKNQAPENKTDISNTIETDSVEKNLANLNDTIKTNKVLRKDTINKSVDSRAIIHKAPNQAEIDSIKSEKLKNKKN